MSINSIIKDPKRILIFSHDNKIGDAVLLNSLIAPLKQQWPNCLIDVVVGKDNAAIWQANLDIGKVFVIPSRSVIMRFWCGLKLSRNTYSIAIVTSGEHQGKSFSIMRWVAQIKRILWISTIPVGSKNDLLVIQNWDKGHYLDRCQAVLNNLIGNEAKCKLELTVPSESLEYARSYWLKTKSDQEINVLLNSGASSSDHRWSPEKVKIISDYILDLNPSIFLHIISQNINHAAELNQAIKLSKHHAQIHIIQPRNSVLDIAALIQGCNVLISPNTFAIHIASAFNTPVIAAYIAQSTVISWGPKSDVSRVIMAEVILENIDPYQIAQSLSDILKLQNNPNEQPSSP
jgi:ADP-heptose:LPS heptosyltransferase